MAVSMEVIKSLRDETGAGIMAVKKALEEANGDVAKARQALHERGLLKAAEKSDRATGEGFVGSYIHTTGKVAGFITLLCETDFVARNDEFRKLANEVAMQVASMDPESVDALLEQEYIRDGKLTISELIKTLSGKVGENITIGQMQRVQI